MEDVQNINTKAEQTTVNGNEKEFMDSLINFYNDITLNLQVASSRNPTAVIQYLNQKSNVLETQYLPVATRFKGDPEKYTKQVIKEIQENIKRYEEMQIQQQNYQRQMLQQQQKISKEITDMGLDISQDYIRRMEQLRNK